MNNTTQLYGDYRDHNIGYIGGYITQLYGDYNKPL